MVVCLPPQKCLSPEDSIQDPSRQIIDLRSPGEFALGAIPSAINVPFLDNDERGEVGTLYKQEGKLLAVQRGLEIFAQKAPNFLSAIESIQTKNPKMILMCWRGGMRSQSIALWLASMGMNICVIKGGYKAYRQYVGRLLEELSQHSFLVLHGKTGSGKTQLIEELIAQNLPAIDFERLARHCGSVFGGHVYDDKPQTQQNFENQLVQKFLSIHNATEIVVEFENALGPVQIPPQLRKKLAASPMVYLDQSLEDRADLLAQKYTHHWDKDKEEKFFDQIKMLQKFLSRQEFESVYIDLKNRQFKEVAKKLLLFRYDKVYEKSLKRHHAQALITGERNDVGDFLKTRLLLLQLSKQANT